MTKRHSRSQRHSWTTQVMPLKLNIVLCGHCGAISKIGLYSTGKRAKCLKTRALFSLSNYQRPRYYDGYTTSQAGFASSRTGKCKIDNIFKKHFQLTKDISQK